MPSGVVDLLSARISRIPARREVRERLADLGSDLAPRTVDEFAAFIRQHLDRSGVKVTAARILPA